MAVRPHAGPGWAEFVRVHRQRARYLMDRGSDPRPALSAAIEVFDRVPVDDRDYDYFLDLGNVFKDQADLANREGAMHYPFGSGR